MRIALDATYSVGENLSGVGVYSREILRGLARRGGAEWQWCYRPHRWRAARREQPPVGCRRRLLIDHWIPRHDLFHGLNQRLPRGRLRRAVVTFHDLFVLTGDYSTPEFRTRFAAQARDAAARADAIITVSEFTARAVAGLLGVEPARIHPIPHGTRFPTRPPTEERLPVILSVGALQKRKNTLRLVEAFERTLPGWRLVLAGSQGYGAGEILARIGNSPRRADIELAGWVDDETLAGLMARASIFAFPSLDEGFGIPVLEAMAWGLPVVTSNRSGLVEAAGEAALLVDPESVEEIAAALMRLVEDENLRRRLAETGARRAAQFPWEKAVERTAEVYRALW